MFEINEGIVKDSLNFETYKKGVRCYENDQVEKLSLSTQEEFGLKKTTIEGKVKSSSQMPVKYDVRIIYPNGDEKVICYCNCKEYYNYNAPCKHIATVLIKYAREKSKLVIKKNSGLIQQLKKSLISAKANKAAKTLNLQKFTIPTPLKI